MLYFLIILAVGVIFLGLKSFKVVPQQEAYVVERWGQFHNVLEPGLRFLVPLMDKLALPPFFKRNSLGCAQPSVYHP